MIDERDRSDGGIEWCHENRLWANSTRPRVALASYPGSGNTWMRYLLQQSTGILTGTTPALMAPSLMERGFGEGINNQSVLVIKTHIININNENEMVQIPFDRAVLLVSDSMARR